MNVRLVKSDRMNKLLSLLLLGFLASCERKNPIDDTAARASGRYAIQSYVVNGDTLYKSRGINRLGASEFYVIIDRKGPDSVRIGSVYKTTGDMRSQTHIKDAGISETNGVFTLKSAVSTQLYEGRIEGGTFFEKSAWGGPSIFVIPPSYTFESSTNPALQGISITAQKQ